MNLLLKQTSLTQYMSLLSNSIVSDISVLQDISNKLQHSQQNFQTQIQLEDAPGNS